MSLAAHTPSVDSTQHEVSDIKRPIANFLPCIWGDLFLKYDSESMEDDNMKQQLQMQKEEVRKIFLSSKNDILQNLNFIDSLQRLGISYHFEREIDEMLEQIYNNFTNNKKNFELDGDLHFFALLFRLIRQKGHHISSDMFEKFKNDKGNFSEKLLEDVQGMWSLYEATQLRIHGEDILDEALDYTYTHLNSLTFNQLSDFLATQIRHCLKTPLHKRVPSLERRCYISSYGEEPSHNKVLLNFAKLDFNLVQKMHQNELGSIARWWKNIDCATKVPYARDRLVEAYFWPLGMSYEPKHSITRRMVGKLIPCISLLDDTYDAYGTVEELELFTQAMQRWDISVIQSLPESMKVVFNTIVEFFDEVEMTIVELGKSTLVVPYIKQDFCKLAQAYLVEAKWCKAGYIPTYDEYKANGIASSAIPNIILTFLMFGEFSNQELLDWILNYPKIIYSLSTFARLIDDISTHKFEKQRDHVATAVDCCMKQYDISQEDARKLILQEIEDYWRILNEECLKLNHVPRSVLECILNVVRVIDFTYENFEDKYTNQELLKDYIIALIDDPISIEQSG